MSVEIEIVIQFLYQQDKRLKLNVGWKREGGREARAERTSSWRFHLPTSHSWRMPRLLLPRRSYAMKGVNVSMARGRCAKLLDNRRANCLLNDSDNVAKFPETIET